MKLDIIIPVYKAKEKIIKTIFSFGELKNYHFIIINDADNIDYTFLKEAFPHGAFTFITNAINSGPGVCRNLGLSAVKYKYCMFIDAGDLIFSIYDFNRFLNTITTGNEVIAPCHYQELQDGTLTIYGSNNNHIHGKIYNIAFLNKYNIRFNENYSYANEDIGFNFLCRLVSNSWQDREDICQVIQTYDSKSLTQNNNCEFYYNQNIMGLAKNAIYAFQKAYENKVPMDKIINFSYSSIIYSYIFYYTTKHQFPQYLDGALAGAKYFYKNYIKNIESALYSQEFISCYQEVMRGIYADFDDPFLLGIPDLTIYDWLRSLAE